MNDAATNKAPLEDLMAAMDVVDTLRHQRGIAERELDGEARRERLLKRLRDLYSAQGIAVPDHVLREGIDALEQERFQYKPVRAGFSVKLAKIWVSRGRWGKPVGLLSVLALLFYGVYFVTDVLPERQLRNALPDKLASSLSSIKSLAKTQEIIDRAALDASAARQAIADKNYVQADEFLAKLNHVKAQLQQQYTIRVVSRAGESSGIWRVPDVNEAGRNYYLIVEAIDNANKVVPLDVVSEEFNTRKKVNTWGLRVSEKTFYKIAEDKQDDGIIQGNQVGRKSVGYLQPQFSIATTGATITEW